MNRNLHHCHPRQKASLQNLVVLSQTKAVHGDQLGNRVMQQKLK
jgi:hypothetical protein